MFKSGSAKEPATKPEVIFLYMTHIYEVGYQELIAELVNV